MGTFEAAYDNSSAEAKVSRVPEQNKVGTLICGKCPSRRFSGLDGGCSGYANKAKAPTSIPWETTCEAIRPPIDLPPTTNLPLIGCVIRITSLQVSSKNPGGSGLRFASAM